MTRAFLIACAAVVLATPALAAPKSEHPVRQEHPFFRGVRTAEVPRGGWCDRACVLRMRKRGLCMAPDTLWSEARLNTLSFAGGTTPGQWPKADRGRCAR